MLDLTAGPHSTATAKPGDPTKLPVDAPAGDRKIPHLDKTRINGEQVARGRPKWYSDYAVTAQDRYWTTGKYSREVPISAPKSTGWDPAAGPPDVGTRKGPNYMPKPYDPDRRPAGTPTP